MAKKGILYFEDGTIERVVTSSRDDVFTMYEEESEDTKVMRLPDDFQLVEGQHVEWIDGKPQLSKVTQRDPYEARAERQATKEQEVKEAENGRSRKNKKVKVDTNISID